MCREKMVDCTVHKGKNEVRTSMAAAADMEEVSNVTRRYPSGCGKQRKVWTIVLQ